MKKLSKFNEWHCDFQFYDDQTCVISRDLYPTKAEAIARILENMGDGYPQYGRDIKEDDLSEDRVRFCILGDGGYDQDERNVPRWCLGSTGKGSMPVWTFRLKPKK